MDILAAVPEEWKTILGGKITIKPVRTASGPCASVRARPELLWLPRPAGADAASRPCSRLRVARCASPSLALGRSGRRVLD